MVYKYLLLLLLLPLSSCLFYKDIVNFQDGYDLDESRLDSIVNYEKWTIQPEDLLLIMVNSSNMEAAQQFNLVNMAQGGGMMFQAMGGGGLSEPVIGNRVDSEGYFDVPVIGKIYALGKTIEDIRNEVEEKIMATGYLRDASVQVIYMTFRLTILGEVNAPGSYIIRSQKINVLEAIGLARDLNIFANRDNILVIREKEGIRSYARINVKSKELFESPYFYLQPNDIVYVEPHRAKVLAAPDPASRYTSTIIGVLSLVTLLISFSR